MSMTNYMELLMTNQPYNLVLFMVIPVGLAEGLVATEFYTLYLKGSGFWRKLNKVLGIVAGLYFAIVFLYLATQVVPQIEWRGWVDVVAVVSYLCGVIPLLSITLLEFGVFGKNLTDRERQHRHFLLLVAFLIVSHIAMIFGMVDPAVIADNTHQHEHHHMHTHN